MALPRFRSFQSPAPGEPIKASYLRAIEQMAGAGATLSGHAISMGGKVLQGKPRQTPVLRRGTLDADLTPSGTADVSETRWNGSSWTTTTRNFPDARVGLPTSDTITSGSVVWVYRAFGAWWVLLAEC